jgi:hypothetical protein
MALLVSLVEEELYTDFISRTGDFAMDNGNQIDTV